MMIRLFVCTTLLLLLLSSCLRVSFGFYVPGVHPITFQEGDEVQLKVNALTSTHTQMPRDYYRLPFCAPEGGPKMASENLGEFLTGNKIQSSPYTINMLKEIHCQKVCQRTLNKLDSSKLRLHIKYDYHHNWIIDNLPSAAIGLGTQGQTKKRYSGGFPIGYVDPQTSTPYIHNHVNIYIDFHPVAPDKSKEGGYRVVAFAVEPLSVKHAFVDENYQWDGFSPEGMNKELKTCPTTQNQLLRRSDIVKAQEVKPSENVLFTYGVAWQESEVEWSSRWDVYLSEDHLVPAQVHWYSITNSILVVLFLSLLVVSILVRNLKRDIAAYNAISAIADAEDDEEIDETGWKLVHADVFRPPSTHPMIYCVFLGSGAQLAITVLIAILLASVGFLSPARRGSLMNAFLSFYMICGVIAGYISSRMYKAFKGTQWQLCTIFTALLFPGIAFGMFLFFNIILWMKQSTGSVPFFDVLLIAVMWCGISIPLVFLGAHLGYKQETMEFPTVTSSIARAIPEPPPMLNPMVGMALTGIIPFAAAYVELFFIMILFWMDQFYYVFGFTLIVYLILIITCAEATVLLVYYQLCAENHRWWWFAFFCSGSTAFYTFIYSVFWFRTLEASRMLMTYLLYFGYMLLISFGMLLVFGTIGALTSLWFVRKIFSTIKVD
jgi:transmembrane 9 superfamily protein 2/4